MQQTLTALARPADRMQALLYDITLVIGGSILVGLCAQISFNLPFSPVPVTGQTFGVLLIGALLGSKRGAISIVAYLTEGSIGLPVFAGGAFGILRIIGPTGGYLLGFIAAAYLSGLLAEKGWDRRVWTTWLAMLIGNIAMYLVGLPWLAVFVGWDKVLALGLYPFIPGAVLKITLAALLLPMLWRLPKEKPQ